MSRSRLETKVGLFVTIGLVVLAVLVLLFSKGFSFQWQTYRVYLRTSSVGGLKKGATVFMSGVEIGSVSKIKLAADGRTVTVTLKLKKSITVHSDADFFIEQSGFLGDQYVTIVPTKNAGPPLKEGDEVTCEPPFNLLEVARNASGFVTRIDDVAKRLDAAIMDLRRLVLNEETLSNVAVTVGTMRTASDHAVTTVDNINALVQTNREPVTTSLSNLVAFSEHLNQLAATLNQVAATNAPEVEAVITNIESASETLRGLVDGLQAGKGLAGTVLKDAQVATNFATLINNLAVTSSNLNRLGLWGILWKPKPPRTNVVVKPIYTGRNPFND
jgi:phospholipid/cholesterol/gamma-HCH transport system substrate-binding protein